MTAANSRRAGKDIPVSYEPLSLSAYNCQPLDSTWKNNMNPLTVVHPVQTLTQQLRYALILSYHYLQVLSEPRQVFLLIVYILLYSSSFSSANTSSYDLKFLIKQFFCTLLLRSLYSEQITCHVLTLDTFDQWFLVNDPWGDRKICTSIRNV